MHAFKVTIGLLCLAGSSFAAGTTWQNTDTASWYTNTATTGGASGATTASGWDTTATGATTASGWDTTATGGASTGWTTRGASTGGTTGGATTGWTTKELPQDGQPL